MGETRERNMETSLGRFQNPHKHQEMINLTEPKHPSREVSLNVDRRTDHRPRTSESNTVTLLHETVSLY